jgi:hypothetical protein
MTKLRVTTLSIFLLLSLCACTLTVGKSNLTIDESSYTTVTMTWSEAKNAEVYEVFRSDNGEGDFNRIGQTNNLSYQDRNLTPSTTYYYKIIPNVTKEEKKISGGDSNVVNVTTESFPAPIVTTGAVSSQKIDVSWTSNPNASSYELYSSETINGIYTLIYSGSSTYTTVANLVPASVYWFSVKAVMNNGSEIVKSDFSPANFGQTIFILNTYSVMLTPSATSVKLSWGGVVGVSGYEIYVSTNYAAIGWTTNIVLSTSRTSASITKLSPSTTYYFWVRSYVSSGGKRYYPSWNPYTYSATTTN